MNKLLQITQILLVAITIASCGGGSSGGSSGSNGGNAASTATSSPITIDAMSTVPVANGQATSGQLYVRNNTNTTISSINFGLQNRSSISSKDARVNANSIGDNTGFILLNSSSCSSIAANSYCIIDFLTPSLSNGSSGNSLVIANYSYENAVNTVTRVINYSYVDISSQSGVNFTDSVAAVGDPGTIQHVVGYLVGGGSSNSIYNGVQVIPSQVGVTAITNGFINGQQIAVGQVLPIEFAVSLTSNSGVTITPSYVGVQNSNVKTKTADAHSGTALNINLTANKKAAHLVFGAIPLLDLTTASQVQINVMNDGTADSTAIAAISTNPNVVINNGCANTVLQAQAKNSCTITYSVNINQPGSAAIEYQIDGNIVASDTLLWINDDLAPVLSITPSASNINTQINSPVSIDFTIANLGTATLSGINFTGLSGYIENMSTTCNADASNPNAYILNEGDVCHVSGDFILANAGSGSFHLIANGSYNKHSYSFSSSNVLYQVTSNANLVFTHPGIGQTPILNVINQLESTEYVFNINNIGDDAAVFTSYGLQNPTSSNPPKINTRSPYTTCNQNSILAANESCSIDVLYGNINSESPIVAESGNINLVVNYHGGHPDAMGTLSSNIVYSLNAIPVTLSVSSNLSGDGSIVTPYMGYGNITNTQSVTLTYTNTSTTETMNNFTVNSSGLPIGLVVNPSSTCNNSTLVAGANCTLILDIDQNALDDQGGSIDFGGLITYPEPHWLSNGVEDNQIVSDSNGNSGFYLNYQQANVVAMLSPNDGTFTSTMLSIQSVNSLDYGNLTLHISPVNTWLVTPPTADPPCIVNSDTSVDCDLTSPLLAVVPVNVFYTMPDNLPQGEILNIPLNFSINQGSHASLNPSSLAINYISPIIANYAYMLTSNNTLLACSLDDGNAWIGCNELPIPTPLTNVSNLTTNGGYLYITSNSFTTPITRCNVNSDGSLSSCISNTLPNIDPTYTQTISSIAIANINSVDYAYLADHDTSTIFRCNLDTNNILANCTVQDGTYGLIIHTDYMAYTANHLYMLRSGSDGSPQIGICSLNNDGSSAQCTYYDYANLYAVLTGIATDNNNHIYIADPTDQAIVQLEVQNGVALGNYNWLWTNDQFSTYNITGLAVAGDSWFSISNPYDSYWMFTNCPLADGACNITRDAYELYLPYTIKLLAIAPNLANP